MDHRFEMRVELKLNRLSKDSMELCANDWFTIRVPMDDGADYADQVAEKAREMYLANYADIMADWREQVAE